MPGSSPPWSFGARSETGYVRSANEDRMGWLRTADGNVIALADGMGGYRGGALAATVVVDTLLQELAGIHAQSADGRDLVRQAFETANTAVFTRRRADDPDTRDMGATGVAIVTIGQRAVIGHVGDSRAYLWHPDKGLRQLTKDHSIVQAMVDAGLLTPEQAVDHPEASTLERALGHRPTVDVDVSPWLRMEPGDTLMVCSDGLCGYASDLEIASAFEPGGRPQEITDRLIDLALAKGGEDNVTVQVLRLGKDATLSTSKLLVACAATAVISVSLSTGWSTWQFSKLSNISNDVAAALQSNQRLSETMRTGLDNISTRLDKLEKTPSAGNIVPPPVPLPNPVVSPPPKPVTSPIAKAPKTNSPTNEKKNTPPASPANTSSAASAASSAAPLPPPVKGSEAAPTPPAAPASGG